MKDITVSGQKFLSEKRILQLLEHKIDKPYNPILIGNGIKTIIAEYANKGKPLAIVYDSLDVNEGIHLFIKIRENPTMGIGDIKIVNNNFVKKKLIRREVVVKPGDLYSQEKIDLSKKHIFETGLFSSVNIRFEDIDTLKNKLSLLVDVRELNMRYLGFDFGFGQDRGISSGSEPYTSIEIEGEWLHRNIFKRGSRLSTKLSNSLNLTNIFTRPKTLAEIVCVEPWLWGFRSSTSFRLFMDNQVLSEQEITRYGGDVALIYQPDKRFYLRAGLEIKGIRFQVEQDTIDARDRERAITFNLRRDHRDNFLYPTKGTVFTLTGKVVPKILRATQYYYKFETSFSQYIN
ncbi:MAG: BamA/TamA family outer membrane protein, partial [Candidatus Marinimicrobia bacterium]|nr:BamA/TamA family outer membrane protein [Candidatus Neomarinimicrobiota bacterium]